MTFRRILLLRDERATRSAGPRRWRSAAVVGAMLAALSPTAGGAGPQQLDPGDRSSPVADTGPTIRIDVNVANGDTGEVAEVFDDLMANVDDQLTELREAENTLADTEVDLVDAREAVAVTEDRIDKLLVLRDEVVTNAFVAPPASSSVDTFMAASMSDLAMKQTLLGVRAGDDASVLDELEKTRDDLEVQKANEDDLALEADAAQNEAAAQLADLESAIDQNTMFFIGVDQRLEHASAEAAALEGLDPELAAELEADREALAEQFQEILDAQEWAEAVEALGKALEEAEQKREEEERWQALEEAAAREADAIAAAAAAENPPAAEIGPASGGLQTVSCPGGGSITVDGSLAGSLADLLSAASADGIALCGGGWRDPAEQIALRESHCGTSQYAVYEMPSSQCSPPTARPGTSQHELGLAIDFTCDGGGAISSQGSSCFVWLDNNAARYGLYNLPSEPWHWSTTGN